MDFLRRVTDSLSITEGEDEKVRQQPTDLTGVDNRKSSFSNFDLDQTTPVSPSRIDPNTMFDELKPQTPASQALRANKELKVTRVNKLTNKIIKKRPKLKNLTKDVKRSRRRRSQIKGKKIDGRHEQYALSIGMMLGIRVCVGKSEQVSATRKLFYVCFLRGRCATDNHDTTSQLVASLLLAISSRLAPFSALKVWPRC